MRRVEFWLEPLVIGGEEYTFTPHPALPATSGEVYALEGGEATVYQLQQVGSGRLFALKVPKPTYRSARALAVTHALASLAAIPGFAAANRRCLTGESDPALIARWPDLEYALLMPWLLGRSWADLLLDRLASAAYTRSHALTLARSLAQSLAQLETLGGAHTDLAGDNLLLSPEVADGSRVELIDLEGVYLPGLPRPPVASQGTLGYRPPWLGHMPRRRFGWGARSEDDLWGPLGDRYAGAMLLTELLVWCEGAVRLHTPAGAEALFQMQAAHDEHSILLKAIRLALAVWGVPIRDLFHRAWAARRLADCPPLSEWAAALNAISDIQA